MIRLRAFTIVIPPIQIDSMTRSRSALDACSPCLASHACIMAPNKDYPALVMHQRLCAKRCGESQVLSTSVRLFTRRLHNSQLYVITHRHCVMGVTTFVHWLVMAGISAFLRRLRGCWHSRGF